MNGYQLIKKVESQFKDAGININNVAFTAHGDKVLVELPSRKDIASDKNDLIVSSKNSGSQQKIVDFVMVNYVDESK